MFVLLATETVSTTSKVSFDGTITISIILALCALIAPSITAFINNRHHYKIRKLELDYDLKKHQTDIQYKDKYEAFNIFLVSMSEYSFENIFTDLYSNEMLSHIHKVKLQCNSDTLKSLEKLQELIHKCTHSAGSYSGNELNEILTEIANAFNKELSGLLSKQNNQGK